MPFFPNGCRALLDGWRVGGVGGQFHAYAQLGSPVTLALGEKIRIPAGDLDITIPVS